MTSLQVDAAAVLVSLAQANIPTDVQELLVYGNPGRGIAPRALEKAIAAVRLNKVTAANSGVDRILQELADGTRNSTLETAAKIAETAGVEGDNWRRDIAAAIRALKIGHH